MERDVAKFTMRVLETLSEMTHDVTKVQLSAFMGEDSTSVSWGVEILLEEGYAIKSDKLRSNEENELHHTYEISEEGKFALAEYKIKCSGKVKSDEAKLFYSFVCARGKSLSDYSTFFDVIAAYDVWIRTGAILEGESCLKV